MKIKLIGYGRTISHRNYGNDKYYVEAELEEWEDASDSLAYLRNWVEREHGLKTEIVSLREKRLFLKEEVVTLTYRIKQIEKTWGTVEMRWKEAMSFLEKHGLKVTETLPEKPDFESLTEEKEEASPYPVPVRAEGREETVDDYPF